ncbi:MAG: glycosyltransferase family 9 protein [Ignavibacteriae bacterium]|nr:MAG: glycosyltransferase family 9 protein [Ignavibacteriota bacterium]
MRILINALSGIGDAVMFSPALAVLKKHFPEARIDMLAMFQQVQDIFRTNPHLNKIYFIDFLHQSKFKSLKEVLTIRANHYDYSINVYPSNRKEYNLLNLMLGAKKRIATKYNNFSAKNFDFLNSILVKEVNDRHNVLENSELVKVIAKNAKEDELGPYEIKLKLDDEVHATEYLIDNLLIDRFIVGFHVGSALFKRHINKRWSAEKYVELAKLLHRKYMASILLFGTEKELNESIYKEIPSFTCIPETSNIKQSLALMQKCKLFVSNDTALMHIAAALNIQQVAIFAYTNYKELHPWKNKHVIVRKELECSPCFFNSPRPVQCIWTGEDEFKCIKTITVDEVFSACVKLVEEVPSHIKPR